MPETLEQAKKRTLEYGRRFGVEYSEVEIEERLISSRNFNIKTQNLNIKNKTCARKIELAEELADKIGNKFGDILLIGVTGSVAAGYPREDSDIDLMIITRKNSLWLTRLKLRWFVFLNQIPHRRFGKKENKNEFCFNLWLEEDNLKVPKIKQNLNNAMDLILMKPVLNKNNTYERFIYKNDWAKKWVATGYKRIKELNPSPAKAGPSLDRAGKTRLLGIVNWVVFWPQWWYMKRRLGKGLVNLKQAFFHP